MGSETKPTVLDLWMCPDCGRCRWPDRDDADGPPECNHGSFYEEGDPMVRRRALVLDDAAVEAAAEALYLRFAEFPTEWSRESEAHHGTWRDVARAVLSGGPEQ